MAFLDVIGELTGFSSNKGWTLSYEDEKFANADAFKGQFIPQGFVESGGDANLGETSTVNKSEPNFQWLFGEGETARFSTRIFATNSFRNVKQQIELLRSLKKRDKDLKRAPIMLFTYGTEISFTCFVKGVNFQYDELRSDGSIRGAIATLALQKIEERITENAATSLAAQIKAFAGIIAGAAGIIKRAKSFLIIPGGSIHTLDRTIQAKQGSTFERIAQQEYGDALLGDILRRAQPDKANLVPGDDVVLLDPTEIQDIVITPQAIPLRDTPENFALREEKLEARNRTTTIFV